MITVLKSLPNGLRRLFGVQVGAEEDVQILQKNLVVPEELVVEEKPVEPQIDPSYEFLLGRSFEDTFYFFESRLPMKPNALILAAKGAARINHTEFVIDVLGRKDVQDYIENNVAPGSIKPQDSLRMLLSRAVESQNLQVVEKILETGICPISPNSPQSSDPMLDPLFISIAGKVPENFWSHGNGARRGMGESWEPSGSYRSQNTETAKNIFKALYTAQRDYWGDDRKGFLRSISGNKKISAGMPFVTDFGEGCIALRDDYAYGLGGIPPAFVEVLEDIDPQVAADTSLPGIRSLIIQEPTEDYAPSQ
jgi:hypothetical protein